MSCGVGHRWVLDLALLWLWHKLAAAAPIRPLAWEPPYAKGAALEKTKKKKKPKQNKTKKTKKQKERKGLENPYVGLMPLEEKKETHIRCFFICSNERPREHATRGWPSSSQEASLSRQRICCHLDLGLLPSRAVRKTCLLLKPHSLWYFVMAACID